MLVIQYCPQKKCIAVKSWPVFFLNMILKRKLISLLLDKKTKSLSTIAPCNTLYIVNMAQQIQWDKNAVTKKCPK